MDQETLQRLIERLADDECLELTNQQINQLYDYMEDVGIDPDDYRMEGNTVYAA